MADQRVLTRIAAWEAAGTIDAATAERLRAAEADQPDEAPAEAAIAAAPPSARLVPSAISAFFGPAVSIIEVFAYLGSGFVLVAWHTLTRNLFPPFDEPQGIPFGAIAVEWLGPALILVALAWFLLHRSERERRAAGVAFGVATTHVFAGVIALNGYLTVDFGDLAVIAAAAGSVAALVFRLIGPSVLTQAGLLVSLAALAQVSLSWLDRHVFPVQTGAFGEPVSGGGVMRPVLTIAYWVAVAIVFGLIARRERNRAAVLAKAGDRAAGPASRRTSVTRFAAGLTVIFGTTLGAFLYAGNGRVLPVIAGDLTILVAAGVLLYIAIRFGSSAYLYPAALGIIIALTDLNSTYIAEQTGTGVAFLIEGVILIGAGFAADRIRRRLAAPVAVAAPETEPDAVPAP
jgi:hypothetical protein